MNTKYIDSIDTERLNLKVLDESFAGIVLNYIVKNKNYLEKWEPTRNNNYYTINYQIKQMKIDMARMKDDLMYKFWIFKEGNNKKVIGSIAFDNIVRGCFHSCYLGYKMDEDEINNGYMTEGLKASIKFAFEELKLHRIEANIIPRNMASLRVVEKLGFCNEGQAKNYLKINGNWEDHIHMVLLNENLE